MGKLRDISGKRFGRLTVLKRDGSNAHNAATWLCQCDCGTTKVITGNCLMKGTTQSCGCLNKEIIIAMGRTRTRSKNRMWKGGRIKDKNGYILVQELGHPRADCHGYIFEHILVMEKMLGRQVNSGEIVHHCNQDKSDNRPYNLRLFASRREHTAYHNKLRKEAI